MSCVLSAHNAQHAVMKPVGCWCRSYGSLRRGKFAKKTTCQLMLKNRFNVDLHQDPLATAFWKTLLTEELVLCRETKPSVCATMWGRLRIELNNTIMSIGAIRFFSLEITLVMR